jgi:hypothetical protein
MKASTIFCIDIQWQQWPFPVNILACFNKSLKDLKNMRNVAKIMAYNLSEIPQRFAD